MNACANHRIASHLIPLVAVLKGVSQVRRLRKFSLGMICRIEGGEMYSPTLRELLRRFYDVEVGMYSYGPLIWPGILPAGTKIGNYCSLAPGIKAFRRNHPVHRLALHPLFYNSSLGLIQSDSIHRDSDNPLAVDHDVWIGCDAIITPSCKRIGLGAVVGAGAVVTKDVAPFTIVAGNPARQIGVRFPIEIQRMVLASRWWEFPIDRLSAFLPLFLVDARVENAQQLGLSLHPRSAPAAD